MDNEGGLLKPVAGHCGPIEIPCGIGPISVDNFFIPHRIDKNDSILES